MTAFTYTPRPPILPADVEHSRQRRYGADYNSAYRGVGGNCGNGTVTVSLFRYAGTRTTEIRIGCDHGELSAHLSRDAMLELARCLIDAAADIEQEIATEEKAA